MILLLIGLVVFAWLVWAICEVGGRADDEMERLYHKRYDGRR
jgi:hypothetical protein